MRFQVLGGMFLGWLLIQGAMPPPGFAEGQSWEFKDHCDDAGESLKTLSKVSQEECQAACETTKDCGGVVYITGWKRCLLKAQIKKSAKLRFISSELNGQRQFEPTGLKIDHDHSGKDLERKVLDTAEDCGKACEQRSDCQAFTYLDGYRVCWLKAKGGRLAEKMFRCGLRKT